MRASICRVAFLAWLAALPGGAFAQQPQRPASAAPVTDWAFTVGLAPVYSPVFMGSKDYALSVFPDLRANYRDEFFASVPEGVGYNIVNGSGWKAGPLVKIRFGRDEDNGGSPFLVTGESKALRGMGTVDTAGEAGGFVQYTYDKLRSRLELRQGFGGHEGLISDASLQYTERLGSVIVGAGPRLTYASEDFMNTYYGINPGQSARTGLGRYKADGGLVSYGLGGSVTVPLQGKWALTAFGGYDRLGQEITDSPLIRQRGQDYQFSVGMGVGYRFSTR